MEYIQEAFEEFNKRTALLGDHLVLELRAIVVSFAVTEYQLFEEALLRQCMPVSIHRNIDGLVAKISDAKHAFTERYIKSLWETDMSRYYVFPTDKISMRLRNATSIACADEISCHRLLCFYNSNLCTCSRPLLAGNLLVGLLMPFF